MLLDIYVQPRAKKTEFGGLHGGAVKIRVKAPPVDGAANAELIKFLAIQLEVPRSAVTIETGRTSRRKRVSITGITRRAIAEKLRSLSPLPPTGTSLD